MALTERILLLPGDGIGPEVTRHARRALEKAAALENRSLVFEEGLIGAAAIDATGEALPPESLMKAKESSAVFLGAVGLATHSGPVRPEEGLLRLRRELNVWCNLRPVRVHEPTPSSPLKPELCRGVDLIIVRELTGGLYFGAKEEKRDRASDLCVYTTEEVERVARRAGRLARRRRGRVTSVDKANVLATSRLWRRVVTEVLGDEFPDIELEHQFVDAFACHLISRPRDFDVVLTENLFGDILSDEAAVIAGSLGVLPSASVLSAM